MINRVHTAHGWCVFVAVSHSQFGSWALDYLLYRMGVHDDWSHDYHSRITAGG